MNGQVKRFDKLLVSEEAALLIVDIQERIIRVIDSYETVIENTLKLIKGFKILNIPIFYTEQYPKGLGHTEKSIQAELAGIEAVQKLSFSCSGAGDLFSTLRKNKISQIVLCGVESHVCVQQTALDLIANGFEVSLAADAVSSRRVKDYEIALERMQQHGIEVTTTEAILFELLNVCGTDVFKQVSKIVK